MRAQEDIIATICINKEYRLTGNKHTVQEVWQMWVRRVWSKSREPNMWAIVGHQY